MKNRSLSVLTVVFSLCLLIFACRKEITYFIHDRTEVPSEVLESAKIYYLQHLETRSYSRKAKAKPFFQSSPVWKKAWITKAKDSTQLLVIPTGNINIGINNQDITMSRFFIFTTSGDKITDGKLIAFWGRRYNVKHHQDFLIKNYNQNRIEQFNGYILQYDVNLDPVSNTVYEDGKIISTKQVSFIALPNSQKPEKELLRTLDGPVECTPVTPVYIGGPPPGLDPECVNIWREDYIYDPITGCLFQLTYTYLGASCPGGGGSGGGTGGSGNGSGSGGSWIGKEAGFPSNWWHNEAWLNENFGLDPYDDFKRLTEEEKILVAAFPKAAYEIWQNKPLARRETIIKCGHNGLNDKSDAFRHAYFQAINTASIGSYFTKMFSDAHESEVPQELNLEKEMDLYNNGIGIDISHNADPGSNLSNLITNAFNSGELKYLNPLNFILSPKYDKDGDDIQDCSYCLNGITIATQLIPTNQ